MLKIRIISLSVLLLLLFGVNANVRTSIQSDATIEKSDKKQSDSNKDSQQKPQQTIAPIDFFGAFSLVNIQLQWRDLHIGLNDEVTAAESAINRTELSLEEVKTLPISEDEHISSSPIITTGIAVLPIRTFRTLNGTTHFECHQNPQKTCTIAYILNCGTYPKSC